ncbi:MAG: S9 family peptidase, partial [Frankiaceae bacterium]|nr:S9 family peptidase [Arenimonas sp.]
MRHRFALTTALFSALALCGLQAGAQTPITLDQAMAHPDWIGPAVGNAWWSWDSTRVVYETKRPASPLLDTWQLAAAGGTATRVDEAAQAGIDSASPVYDAARTRLAFVRHGDIFERDQRSGTLTQVTRSSEEESDPQYSADGRSLQFRVDNSWYAWNSRDRLVDTIAIALASKDPAAKPAADAQRDMQLRLIATLKRQSDDREAQRQQGQLLRKLDPTRVPAPAYLGDDIKIDGTALAPNGRWLLVVTSPKSADVGRVGKLPRYVTESGYEEFEDQRVRVGRNSPIAQGLKLVELATGKVRDLAFDTLPAIAVDPLADLRKAQKLDPLKGNRPLRVLNEGDNSGAATIRWSADGSQLAVQVR